jgi:hypothetical protein
MQLKTVDYTFALLTPCFSGTALGKNDDHAEMRVPPIRGHVRFWHRELFGANDANQVWGSTSGDEGRGGRVGMRLAAGHLSDKQPADILPHDLKKSGNPRPSLREGGKFMIYLQRLIGCTNNDWDHAQRAVKTWLLLGCLGLRSNRAAGSVWPLDDWARTDADSLKSTLISLGLKNWSVAIVGLSAGKSEAVLRETASDTIAGSPHRQVFGGISPREPSLTKFKVALLAPRSAQKETPCLLALAPHRQLQGNGGVRRTILKEAEHLLWNVKPNPARWKALGAWSHILP